MNEEKTVAQKALEKAQQMREENKQVAKVSNTGMQIEGLHGLEREDVNITMPYVYLVRGGSQHAELEKGGYAPAGSFYHATKRTSQETMEVVIVAAAKLDYEKKDDAGNLTGETERYWKTIMFEVDNPAEPFTMSFKGMNYWYGWKDLTTALLDKKVGAIYDYVVRLKSEKVATKAGVKYDVVKPELLEPTQLEDVETAQIYAQRLSILLQEKEKEVRVVEPVQTVEEVKAGDGEIADFMALLDEEN